MVGILLIALEVTQYNALIRELQIELVGLIIGCVFMGFGIWFGVWFFNGKKETTHYSPEELGLSKRETEVLALLAEGYSNQEIADRLFVSLNTAKTHISNIYSKLGVSRRTQAVEKARKLSFASHSEE